MLEYYFFLSFLLTLSTALPIEGANRIDDTMTTKTRMIVYNILVVRDDFAPGPEPQQIPHAEGPRQQHNSSKQHIVYDHFFGAGETNLQKEKKASKTKMSLSHDKTTPT